ncbi:hypothetical protein HanRHA438_Chr04g0189931 [Helianthus annuus]|nr:hypothetical protein HanRHA438_Chr04g0189931 [Helianthus annuus]
MLNLQMQQTFIDSFGLLIYPIVRGIKNSRILKFFLLAVLIGIRWKCLIQVVYWRDYYHLIRPGVVSSTS